MQIVLPCVIVVDNHIVRALEWGALEKAKSPVEPVKTGRIDAGHRIEKSRLLDQDTGGCGDVWLAGDKRQHPCGKRPCRADDGAARSAHDDIGADSARAALLLLEHAVAQTDKSQHHGDLNCDRNNAEQRPHRPVRTLRSEEHTSELQSHSFISYAVF